MNVPPSRVVVRLLVLAGALCLAAAAAVAWLGWRADLGQQQHALSGFAEGVAATIAGNGDPHPSLDAALDAGGLAGAVLLDGRGRPRARSGPTAEGWRLLAVGASSTVARWQGERVVIARAPTGDGGTLVLLRPAQVPPLLRTLAAPLAVGALAWLLLAGGIVATARRPPLRPALAALAGDLARAPAERGDADDLAATHGEVVRPLLWLAERLEVAHAERDAARSLLGAAIGLGAHYTAVCTLDGRALDASPSLLARTGLSAEDLRQRPDEGLSRVLDLGTLLPLAARSLREGVALSGIPTTLRTPAGDRPLTAALRAVDGPDGPLLLLTAQDRAREEELERQIDGFTDAVELMVDQRVAHLTAGQRRTDEALEAAGLAAFEFDRQGGTQRLNAVAERLTGRTVFTLRQFGQVAAALCPEVHTRESMHSWFWASPGQPLTVAVATPGGTRTLQWYVGVWKQAGEVAGRLLLGAPVPPGVDNPGAHPGAIAALDRLLSRQEAAGTALADRAHLTLLRDALRRIEAGGDGATPRAPFISR